MKSIFILPLALASSVAAWGGTVEFCIDGPGRDFNPGYDCASYIFNSEDCFDLPKQPQGWGHPNLQGHTHYAAPSHGLICDLFPLTGCEGLAVTVMAMKKPYYHNETFSSVMCFDGGLVV